MGLISVRHISKVFKDVPGGGIALNDVCLDIEKGEFIAIMGPSGSGKSTLLNILGAMSAPTDGEVVIDDISVYSLSTEELADFRAWRLGFVFQQLHLVSYLSAIENVMLPLLILRRPQPPFFRTGWKASLGINPEQTPDFRPGKVEGLILRERKSLWDTAFSTLQQVGLAQKAGCLPGQLSSGEQARVAMARALVKAPPIILADEPTGNLDSKNGQEIVHLLHAANERGHTIIMVTHNKDAARGAQRRVYLRDGMVVAGDE